MLEQVRQLAREAGDAIMQIYGDQSQLKITH